MRLILAAFVAALLLQPVVASAQAALKQIAAIPMPNVAGRIDHLGFDAPRQRLFVAALGNDTVEVIDTAKSARLRSLTGFHEPQGIAVVSDLNLIAVANGGTGTLQLVDAATLQVGSPIAIGGDADNVRYDAAARQIFVAYQGGIAVVDPSSGVVVHRIRIEGHPESFQLEAQGSRLYANVPGAAQIVVAQRESATVLTRWPTAACGANYPMALDEATRRLLVGCRRPASIALFDTGTGKLLGSIPAVGDTDDLFYDGARRRAYIIGGEGFIDVVARDGDALRRSARVATTGGARTGVWVAEQDRLYLAVPARGRQPAEIRVFSPQ